MIQSFGSKATAEVFYDGCPPKWHPNLCHQARRALALLDAAYALADLAAVPGFRLEKLQGALVGFWSVRVNRQWRIIFRWGLFGPEEVELIDYH